MTDIQIAQQAVSLPIGDIAASCGIDPQYVEQYGRCKAKIDYGLLREQAHRPDGKLILVTAITPTPAGEGKTTTTVGLTDGLRKIGKNAVAALREPSLGPVFGVKGGAAGGGYAQVIPMEDINLHFTGDFHAIGAANNLLAALLDNHIQQGNALGIDIKQIVWKRCVDMNDRQLRHVIDGLGGKMQGVPREDGFDITVASEVMAVLCLASDIADLKARLGRMIVAYTFDGRPVTAHDLKAEGAMAALLKDALKPNLVQTLEHSPAFIHGGPFANIAHGCNSVTATRMALKLGDYAVTEAGFAADLGAEKFFDIKCRLSGLRPSAVVIVATVRALKYHGGVPKAELGREDLSALEKGLPNLLHHVNTIRNTFHLPCVVAINAFPTDTAAELRLVEDKCRVLGVNAVLSEVWAKGGEGGRALAQEVVRLCDQPQLAPFSFAYPDNASLAYKLNAIVGRVYGGAQAVLTPAAQKQLQRLTELGFGDLPVCMAKTQYSLSDDPTLLGAPTGFTVTDNEFDYKDFMYYQGKVEGLGNVSMNDYFVKGSEQYKAVNTMNEFIFAFGTDTGSINTYIGYTVTPDCDETFVKEFAYAAKEAVKGGAGTFTVCLTDYGWHIMYCNYAYKTGSVYGEAETIFNEGNKNEKGEYKDDTFAKYFYESLKSAAQDENSSIVQERLLTDYKTDTAVKYYTARYQDLLDMDK